MFGQHKVTARETLECSRRTLDHTLRHYSTHQEHIQVSHAKAVCLVNLEVCDLSPEDLCTVL